MKFNSPLICITQIDNTKGVINLIPVEIPRQDHDDVFNYIKYKAMLENEIKKEKSLIPIEQRQKKN